MGWEIGGWVGFYVVCLLDSLLASVLPGGLVIFPDFEHRPFPNNPTSSLLNTIKHL